jgi:hypothetical protein
MGGNVALAIGIFVFIGILFMSYTKRSEKNKPHTYEESLSLLVEGKVEEFEKNRQTYLNAIKEGKYDKKKLACRGVTNINTYYECLERVYFES